VKPWLICLLLAALSTSEARAIVRGTEISAANMRSLKPLLKLGFNRSPCTGTHIGQGKILTAYHCVAKPRLAHQDRPDLCVFDVEGDSLGCVFGGDYSVAIPAGTDTRTILDAAGRRVTLPLPDIAVLTISDDSLRRKITSLDTVVLPDLSAVLSRESQGVWMAGAGCNTYDPGFFSGDGTGTLRVGISPSPLRGANHYLLLWRPIGIAASACPGDSGGPLYTLNARGRMVQHGVASHIILNRNDDDDLVSVMSHYGRIDTTTLLTWTSSLTP